MSTSRRLAWRVAALLLATLAAGATAVLATALAFFIAPAAALLIAVLLALIMAVAAVADYRHRTAETLHPPGTGSEPAEVRGARDGGA